MSAEKTKSADKQARLAEALRANLKRRKGRGTARPASDAGDRDQQDDSAGQ